MARRPNHYVSGQQLDQISIKVHPLMVRTRDDVQLSFPNSGRNTLFGLEQWRGVVFYDHALIGGWPAISVPGRFPGAGPFYQCVAVSQTGDPVSGGWFLYAIQHDPANPTWIGD